MYDRIVDVPRLDTARVARQARRARADGAAASAATTAVRLPSITANLYRDGNDSVAWHGDRIGRQARRHRRRDPVARLHRAGSCSAPTAAARRSATTLAPGDLLVLGGTCQRTWEHCVPKRAHAGPRISVMFRAAPGVQLSGR